MASGTRRSTHTAVSPDDDADDEADPELADEEHRHVGDAVVVVRQPLDEAEHEQDGHGIVEARSRPRACVASRRLSVDPRSSAKIAAPSVAAQHRAEQQPVERREVEEPHGRQARDHGGHDRPDHRQAERRRQHGPDLEQPRGQAALEEDQRQGDDPDAPREP